MKNYLKIAVLLAAVSVAGLSCKKEEPKEEEHAAPFEAVFDIQPGVTTFHRLSSLPKASVTVTGEDPDALYEMSYSVGGGLTKTVRLKNGQTRRLDTEFTKMRSYGSTILEGKVYNIDYPEEYQEFSETVWTRYRDIDIVSAFFAFPGGMTALSSQTELFMGSYGSLTFNFSPEDSSAEFRVMSTDETCLVFDTAAASREDGKFLVPYRAVGAGMASVKLTLINGDEETEKNWTVTCKDDNEGRLMGVAFSVGGLSVKGMGLDLFVDPIPEAGSQVFDVLFFVNGQMVSAMASTTLANGIQTTVSNDNIPEGHHTASVRVTPLEGSVRSVMKEAEFDVCVPKLLLNNDVAVQGETLSLEVGKTYSMSIIGVPVTHYDKIDFSFNEELDTLEGGGVSWILSPVKYGYGSISLVYEGGLGRAVAFDLRRNLYIQAYIEESRDNLFSMTLDKGGMEVSEKFIVQSSFQYQPMSEYTYAVTEGQGALEHQNRNATYLGETKKKEFSHPDRPNDGAPFVFADLTLEAAAIAGETYTGSMWQYDAESYSWSVAAVGYPMSMHLKSATVSVLCTSVSSSTGDDRCIIVTPSFEEGKDWSWLTFTGERQ